jgi:hypothetical protein
MGEKRLVVRSSGSTLKFEDWANRHFKRMSASEVTLRKEGLI